MYILNVVAENPIKTKEEKKKDLLVDPSLLYIRKRKSDYRLDLIWCQEPREFKQLIKELWNYPGGFQVYLGC